MISFDSYLGFPTDFIDEKSLINWLNACAALHSRSIQRLAYQFCSEDEMLACNRQYLGHDYYTDILTFPERTQSNTIRGDVLINVDRLKDNADVFGQTDKSELLRLMAHGLLHLCGFRDDDVESKTAMTEGEELCIALLLPVEGTDGPAKK